MHYFSPLHSSDTQNDIPSIDLSDDNLETLMVISDIRSRLHVQGMLHLVEMWGIQHQKIEIRDVKEKLEHSSLKPDNMRETAELREKLCAELEQEMMKQLEYSLEHKSLDSCQTEDVLQRHHFMEWFSRYIIIEELKKIRKRIQSSTGSSHAEHKNAENITSLTLFDKIESSLKKRRTRYRYQNLCHFFQQTYRVRSKMPFDDYIENVENIMLTLDIRDLDAWDEEAVKAKDEAGQAKNSSPNKKNS